MAYVITRDNIRNVCIDYNLFTYGTCEEYDEFLNAWEYEFDDGEFIEDIGNICGQIAATALGYSDMKMLGDMSGMSDKRILDSITHAFMNCGTFI